MLERLTLALARVFWRHALLAGLILGAATMLIFSVDHAGWVAGVEWGPLAWPALLGGAALARSRWRGGWSFLYMTALLMAGAAELVGHVLPDPAQFWLAPGEWVWNLHLRTVTLAQRVQTWSVAIAHGQPVGDTGLFVWLIALIVGGVVAWLAWGVLRRRQALAACLPAALALAINTYLSGQTWQEVLVFVVLTLALIIYTTYANQNADWDRRGVDFPDNLGLDWAIAAVGLTLSIGAFGAVAPVVATPSGWHLLADLLAASRQQVVSTADQLFTGVRAPSTGLLALVARTPDLTNIGSAVDQSPATVMWVKLDEAPPLDYPNAPPPPQHYWRSGLYATYTGTGWQALSVVAGDGAAVSALDPPPPGRYVLRQQFEIVAEHGQAQFAVSRPISATAGALVSVDALDGGTALLAGSASAYMVDSFATRVTQAELRAAGTNYPAAIRAAYLQVPSSLPGRVASLAAQIAGAATDPYDESLRLQDYLRQTYVYRLDVPPAPAGRDAVDYFLYEAPGGYCTYFASALAVMLRTLGVPARVATGYAMGEYDSSRGAYRVAGAAAHAWVEVYFPTYGWVEFEPTPARAVFERPAGGSVATATPAVAPPGGPAAVSPAARVWAVWAGLWVALLAVAGWARWQFAARRPTGPRQRVLWLYGRMRSALSRAGLSAPASVTPGEYLQARAAVLSERPPLLAAVTETTRLFQEAAYSAHPIQDAEARAAERSWAGARAAWLRLVIRGLAQRLLGV